MRIYHNLKRVAKSGCYLVEELRKRLIGFFLFVRRWINSSLVAQIWSSKLEVGIGVTVGINAAKSVILSFCAFGNICVDAVIRIKRLSYIESSTPWKSQGTLWSGFPWTSTFTFVPRDAKGVLLKPKLT